MTDSDATPSQVFELERIRNLVELMKEYDLREVDLRQGEERIRLCRGAEPVPVSYVPPPVAAGAGAGSSAPASAVAGGTLAPAESASVVMVKSPMVGTFYSRPNPKAAPYVKVGDHVEPDTTVCIIEAMKVFNEIPAEVRGRVVAVLAGEEEAVEFGTPLFKVDTAG